MKGTYKKISAAVMSVMTIVSLLMNLIVFPVSADTEQVILATDFSDGIIPGNIFSTYTWGSTEGMSVINEGSDGSECLKYTPQGDGEGGGKTDDTFFFPANLDAMASALRDDWRDAEITIAFDMKFAPGGTGDVYAGLKMCKSWTRDFGSPGDPVVGQSLDNKITPGAWTSLSTTFKVSDYYATESGLCVYFTYWQQSSANPEYWIDNVKISMKDLGGAPAPQPGAPVTVWEEDFEASASVPSELMSISGSNLSTDSGKNGRGLKLTSTSTWDNVIIKLSELAEETDWLYKDITITYDYKVEFAASAATQFDWGIRAATDYVFNESTPGYAIPHLAAPWTADTPAVPKGAWTSMTATFNLVDTLGKAAVDAGLANNGVQIFFDTRGIDAGALQYFDNFKITIEGEPDPTAPVTIWEEDFESSGSVPTAAITSVSGGNLSIGSGKSGNGLKLDNQEKWESAVVKLSELTGETDWLYKEITLTYDYKVEFSTADATFNWGIRAATNYTFNDSKPYLAVPWTTATPAVNKGEWTSMTATFNLVDVLGKTDLDAALVSGGVQMFFSVWEIDVGALQYFDNFKITVEGEPDPNVPVTIWEEDFEENLFLPDTVVTTTEGWSKYDNLSVTAGSGKDGGNGLKYVRSEDWHRGVVLEMDPMNSDTSWLYKDITFSYDYKMESTNTDSAYNYADYAVGVTVGHDFDDWKPETAAKWCIRGWEEPGVPKGTWKTITTTFNLVDLMGKAAIDAALASGDGIQIYLISWPEKKMDMQQYYDNFKVVGILGSVTPEPPEPGPETTIWEEDFEASASVPAEITSVSGGNLSVDSGKSGSGLKLSYQNNWDCTVIKLDELSDDISWLYEDITLTYDFKVEFASSSDTMFNWGIKTATSFGFNDWEPQNNVKWLAQAWTEATPAVNKGEWTSMSVTFNLVDVLGKDVIDAALASNGVQITLHAWEVNTGASQHFDNFKIIGTYGDTTPDDPGDGGDTIDPADPTDAVLPDGHVPLWKQDFTGTADLPSIITTINGDRGVTLSKNSGALKFKPDNDWDGVVLRLSEMYRTDTKWLYGDISIAYNYRVDSDAANVEWGIRTTVASQYTPGTPGNDGQYVTDVAARGNQMPTGAWQTVTLTFNLVDLLGKSVVDEALANGGGIQIFINAYPNGTGTLQYFDNFTVGAEEWDDYVDPYPIPEQQITLWEQSFENGSSVPGTFTTIGGNPGASINTGGSTRTILSIGEGRDGGSSLRFEPIVDYDDMVLKLSDVYTADYGWLYGNITVQYDYKAYSDNDEAQTAGVIHHGIRTAVGFDYNQGTAENPNPKIKDVLNPWDQDNPPIAIGEWRTYTVTFNLVNLIGEKAIDDALDSGSGIQLVFGARHAKYCAVQWFDNMVITADEWDGYGGGKPMDPGDGKNIFEGLLDLNAPIGGTVKGRLVDENGKPIEGATLILRSDPITVITDENGNFIFTNVPAGTHTLHLVDKNGKEFDSAKKITLKNGETVTVNAIFDGTKFLTELTSDGAGTGDSFPLVAVGILFLSAAAAVLFASKKGRLFA